eukprot:TRINITY_DN1513_c1_g1_i1.p1 TRINITY_DN1513_c1_g1~~TRINITY_DN1513_c1_g1_i1.p1  ORF type:complete len:799 (+),score=254.32 TRINITY_DN1513_c1_g1_i1:178-2574(+)
MPALPADYKAALWEAAVAAPHRVSACAVWKGGPGSLPVPAGGEWNDFLDTSRLPPTRARGGVSFAAASDTSQNASATAAATPAAQGDAAQQQSEAANSARGGESPSASGSGQSPATPDASSGSSLKSATEASGTPPAAAATPATSSGTEKSPEPSMRTTTTTTTTTYSPSSSSSKAKAGGSDAKGAAAAGAVAAPVGGLAANSKSAALGPADAKAAAQAPDSPKPSGLTNLFGSGGEQKPDDAAASAAKPADAAAKSKPADDAAAASEAGKPSSTDANKDAASKPPAETSGDAAAASAAKKDAGGKAAENAPKTDDKAASSDGKKDAESAPKTDEKAAASSDGKKDTDAAKDAGASKSAEGAQAKGPARDAGGAMNASTMDFKRPENLAQTMQQLAKLLEDASRGGALVQAAGGARGPRGAKAGQPLEKQLNLQAAAAGVPTTELFPEELQKASLVTLQNNMGLEKRMPSALREAAASVEQAGRQLQYWVHRRQLVAKELPVLGREVKMCYMQEMHPPAEAAEEAAGDEAAMALQGGPSAEGAAPAEGEAAEGAPAAEQQGGAGEEVTDEAEAAMMEGGATEGEADAGLPAGPSAAQQSSMLQIGEARLVPTGKRNPVVAAALDALAWHCRGAGFTVAQHLASSPVPAVRTAGVVTSLAATDPHSAEAAGQPAAEPAADVAGPDGEGARASLDEAAAMGQAAGAASAEGGAPKAGGKASKHHHMGQPGKHAPPTLPGQQPPEEAVESMGFRCKSFRPRPGLLVARRAASEAYWGFDRALADASRAVERAIHDTLTRTA